MLAVLLLAFSSFWAVESQKTFYNCSGERPYGLDWRFHCFEDNYCTISDMQICSVHVQPKCPDKSDQNSYFCQRVG